MDQAERTKRIAQLARAQWGRRKRQTFLHDLSSACGQSIHADQLLNLEATDRVLSFLRAGYAAAVAGEENSKRTFFAKVESTTALAIPGLLAKVLAEEHVIVWLKQSEDCGAVTMTAGCVLSACEAIRGLDGDAVSLLSQDLTQGFIFDKHPDDIFETFEVSVWGSKWFEVARRLAY